MIIPILVILCLTLVFQVMKVIVKTTVIDKNWLSYIAEYIVILVILDALLCEASIDISSLFIIMVICLVYEIISIIFIYFEYIKNEKITVFSIKQAIDSSDTGILVLKDGSNAGKVQFASGKYSVIGTSVVLIPNDVNDAKFLYFALLAVDFDKYKVGSGIPHIYFKDYSNEQIYYPAATLRERIIKTLNCYETKVEIEKEILSALQKQKTFLLQSMFI